MTEVRTLDLLLEDVAKEGRNLTNYFHSNSFYQPCFRPGGLGEYPELPEDIQESRRKLREAAKAVHDLATGPSEYVRQLCWSFHDSAALRWLVHFGVPQAVPLSGSVTYTQVANTCNVDESYLRRILRYTMLNNIFYEPTPGDIAHTPFSAVLVTNPHINAMVQYDTMESFPACTSVVEAYEKWGPSEEPNHNAWCLANKAHLPIWEQLRLPGYEERADRFVRLMSAINATPGYDIKYTVEEYNWKSAKGTIVDVGGSTGQTAIALLKAHPDLPQIIIEDLPLNVENAEASLPSDLKQRIFFKAHDFFHPQPESILSAKLFILRLILHDHSDKYARRILRQLLPALKNGATLVVIDSIVPSLGTKGLTEEMELRRLDLEMMQNFSGKEREMEDWEDLFRSADKNLIVRNVNQPVGSALGIMEVVHDG